MPRTDPGVDLPDLVLLPGFVGMNMDDADGRRIWLSTLPIAAGELAPRLALDPSGTGDASPGLGVRPNGPIGFVYGRAIRAFEEAGLSVHVFPLECRQDALRSAAQLADFVKGIAAARPGKRFVFVGHSMGAILAALYPYNDADWEERIAAAVFFGGTLAGTFEPVEGLTGTHWFLQVIGVGDPVRERAIRQAMSTWPGIFSMLPDPQSFPEAAAVYDARAWPAEVRPPQAWLDHVRDELRPMVRESPLPKIPTAQLLSLVCPTVDTLGWTPEGLRAGPMNAAGDGTVPARTSLAGVRDTFEIDFPHTFMPNDPKAIQAAVDIARGGWPELPKVSAERAAARLAFAPPPPVTMAKAMLESLAHRALSGHLGLDDLAWPFLR
jgi:pimeloyl-ACP methyl ester carboxylesterase